MAKREIDRLDNSAVKAAETPGLHPDGDGLYLHISDSGSKSWILRYRLGGKRRDMGLGRYPLFTLADARKRANTQRRLIADQVDPLANGRRRANPIAVAEAPAGITFAQVAELVIAAKRSAWSPKQEKNWRQTLRDHVPFGGKPVAAVNVDMIENALRPIWSTKRITATRVRQRIEAVLDFATVKKFREGDNPARWTGHLEHILAGDPLGETSGHEALPHTEVADFMAQLPDTLAGKALAFTILTGARTGEALKATWSEFDLRSRLWTVPASHMKERKEHKIPVSDAALAILAGLPSNGEPASRVFPIGAAEMWRVAKKLRPEITVHGFRATFRTWAQETTDFPSETVEHCLAHITGDASERAYKRGDAIEKRREVMAAWADHCAIVW
jgi:integrase